MEMDKSGFICQATMQALNEQRKDNSLCDVNIIVEGQIIKAHRCVLVAGSEYFKSLFCGPLKQDVSEVCLSDVTDDVDSTAAVIDFLYTGKIIIDKVNLEGVLKLSSFLLVAVLREICVEYMEATLNLDRCLQYYLLSVDHMLPEITQELSNAVLSRFHDCLIFKDSSLSVSPSQLRYLMESCDIFEHCFIPDIVSFVIDWVKIGDTEEHEQIGCEVLEYISRMSKLSNNREFLDKENLCSILSEKLQLKTDDDVSHFRAKLNCIIGDYLKEPLNGAQNSDLQTVSLDPNNKSPEFSSRLQDNEHVLIAIAPNQYFMDFCDGYSFRLFPYEQTIFDICIYVPSKKTWYYLTECKNSEAFLKTERYDTGFRQSFILNNHLCILPSFLPSISMFDMGNFTWSEVSFKEIIEQNNILYTAQDVNFITHKDGMLYMILRILSNTGVFFNCYKFLPHKYWVFFCSTHNVNTQLSPMRKRRSQFSAEISANGKEMILAYALEKLHVFTFHLDSVQRSDSTLCYFQHDIDLSTPFCIVEVEDHFCIVEDVTDDQQIKYRCRCRYRLGSNKLSTDVTTELSTDVFDSSLSEDRYTRSPCKPFFLTTSAKCIWLFEGNNRESSSLKSLSFGDIDPVTVSTHKPPPFLCITSMVAGDVSREILDSLTPIRTFLQANTIDNSSLSNEEDNLSNNENSD